MQFLYLIVPVAPLIGALVAGLFGWAIGRRGAHWITILLMIVSTAVSAVVFFDVLGGGTDNVTVYKWLDSGNTSFQIGFLVFLPFLVVDMVVANVLLALGMHMLSPTQISMPFKLLLFVLVDGWFLLARALVLGYA